MLRTPAVQWSQCPEGEAPMEPPQMAQKDTLSPCTQSGARGQGTPQELTFWGMVVWWFSRMSLLMW